MRYLQLFGGKPTHMCEYSPVFTIFPGSAGVLSAFNLGTKVQPEPTEAKNAQQKFIIQKLVFASGIYPEKLKNKTEKDEDEGLGCQCDAEIIFAEDVTQGGMWNLNPCSNTGVIILPGTYRVRFNDPCGLEDVALGLTRYNSVELPYIPRGLILGD